MADKILYFSSKLTTHQSVISEYFSAWQAFHTFSQNALLELLKASGTRRRKGSKDLTVINPLIPICESLKYHLLCFTSYCLCGDVNQL